MFRYLLSILLLLIISPCMGDLASVSHVNEMRDNVQAKIDNKAKNDNYTQNMVLQTDSSGNVVATTVGTDLLADGAIETMHLADGAVTNADLAGMIDITKLNLGTLPTSGKHMMIWNAETQKYVFERYATSILPDGYTQLEYIESTGTQYIDTGIKVNDMFGFYISFQYTTNDTHEQLLFGALSPNFAFWRTDSKFSYGYKTGVGLSGRFSIIDSELLAHSLEFNFYNNGDIKLDNIVQQLPQASFLNNNSVFLFAANLGTSAYNSADVRIFSIKVTDGSDLVHSFIPVKRVSDGVIGMYDTVTKTFFTNSGTGEFIAGPEI